MTEVPVSKSRAMKIGVLTFHSAHNYGAVLQAYGLQRELEAHGHEVEFIHYYSHQLEAKNRYKRPLKSPKDLVAKSGYLLFSGLLKRRFERFESFQQNQLRLSPRYHTVAELEAGPTEYDAYVCGSDQIWNFSEGASPVYFLRFLPTDRPAIAYAPSFGKTFEASSAPEHLADWIQRFQYLSARESSGVDFIQELAGRSVPQVLDPAFFLDGEGWGELAAPPLLQEPYLLFYALEMNARTNAIIRYLSDTLKVRIVIAGKGGSFMLGRKTRIAIDSGPAEFLGLIRNARFVLSNSFHATVFSMLFGVPFLTIGHSSRNARMESLLSMAGLGARLIRDVSDLHREPSLCNVECKIDLGDSMKHALDISRNYLNNSLLEIASRRGAVEC